MAENPVAHPFDGELAFWVNWALEGAQGELRLQTEELAASIQEGREFRRGANVLTLGTKRDQ